MSLPEEATNHAIAAVLSRMSSTWLAKAELSGQLRESKGLRVDILVENEIGSPMVIENEYEPGNTVEEDALKRLDKTFEKDGSKIVEAIALKSPAVLRECESIEEAQNLIPTLDFEYALLRLAPAEQGSKESPQVVWRTPKKEGNYLKGTITTFAEFLTNAGITGPRLRMSIEELELGVKDSIGILSNIANQQDNLKSELANLLMQVFSESDIEQGLGIAATVVINATLFQQKLATNHSQILTLAQMRGRGQLNQSGLIEQWREILNINYWPIYSIALSVMEAIEDPYVASRFINRLFTTTQNLIDLGVMDTHDLCGVVFQRFMTERKSLASFYTRPESATLLAHLAVPDVDWSDPEVYSNFKFADYACGTGTLVHGVYQRIAHLHEFAGGDPAQAHAHMLEQNVTAADIVPSAAHLTATLLSSLFPNQTYRTSRIVVPDYGAVEGGHRVSLGSLELLADEDTFHTLFPNPGDGSVIGPEGKSGLSYEMTIKRESQDLVIMNPPYTRSMSDWLEGGEGTWKPFKSLGNTKATQRKMRAREKELTANLKCFNGYQSMPSAFCGIADQMLKSNGTFAFVLPSTSLQGVSWSKFRKMLAEEYCDNLVVSIAGASANECAWSADTNLAEVLIVARKKAGDNSSDFNAARCTLVNLHTRPSNSMLAAEYAHRIKSTLLSETLRTIEDGPNGGTPLLVGGELIGEIVSCPMDIKGWRTLGIQDISLAQCAHQLALGRLWFPRSIQPSTHTLAIRRISEFATVGYAANNIANNQNCAYQRIPVTSHPNYPMMWAKSSSHQTCVSLDPDQEGRIRVGREELADRIWERRSRSVLACEVAYSSQALVAGYASQEVIGGRAWPNVQLANSAAEKAFVLWGNTSLGLLSFWYNSSRQQVNRGMVTVSDIADMPWLDTTSLDISQLEKSEAIFEQFKNRNLLPVCSANKDPVRKELDREFFLNVLGLPMSIFREVERIREKWCAEPSVKCAD